MNVPGIRKALTETQQASQFHQRSHLIAAAVVRVGLRACDALSWCNGCLTYGCAQCARAALIADILREAGVEVEG